MLSTSKEPLTVYLAAARRKKDNRNKNASGIRAFYFKSPDSHALDILEFPPDKGDPKWHRATDKLFLGIDRAAIAVSDTDGQAMMMVEK